MPPMPTRTIRVPVRYPKNASYPHHLLQPGNQVRIVPEPENPADPNALRIDDGTGRKMGYVPRELAADMAPPLREGLIRLGNARVVEVDPLRVPVLVIVEATIHVAAPGGR